MDCRKEHTPQRLLLPWRLELVCSTIQSFKLNLVTRFGNPSGHIASAARTPATTGGAFEGAVAGGAGFDTLGISPALNWSEIPSSFTNFLLFLSSFFCTRVLVKLLLFLAAAFEYFYHRLNRFLCFGTKWLVDFLVAWRRRSGLEGIIVSCLFGFLVR